MKHIACMLAVTLLSFGVFARNAIDSPSQETTESYSFENDFEGWSVNATDVGGNAPIEWSVTRSQDMAKDGATSVKFDLVNTNDAGKIWIEKAFVVEPNQTYAASVRYAFASNNSDGSANQFTIITGVLNEGPSAESDLRPAFKDATAKGCSEPGFKWQEKEYDFAVRSTETGRLHVVIGIWGTWEVHNSYYCDAVLVTFSKKPERTEFFSFENNIEGWMPNGTDLELGGGFIDWSIARVQEYALDGEDGTMSLKFDLNNSNGRGKIWVERPFSVEPKNKYKVTVDYAFHSNDCGDTPRFRIMTGVFRKQQQSGDDLIDAFQEKTTSCFWGWVHKSYEFTLKSKKSDVLYVVIGIKGTKQAHRTYNFDSVCVTLTKK
jgi:hypothetical protein